MRKLSITTGPAFLRFCQWTTKPVTWSEFVRDLKAAVKVYRGGETMADYDCALKEQKGEWKDVGGFIGGAIEEKAGKQGACLHRDFITLDADDAVGDLWELFTLLFPWAAACYPTRSDRPGKRKFRLVLPLSRKCSPKEWEAVSKWLAGQLGIDQFDIRSFVAKQGMYWPSGSADQPMEVMVQEGDWIDVGWVLGQYQNWQDRSEWPRKKGEGVGRDKKDGAWLGDPRDKAGVIGAYCTEYSIDDLMEGPLATVYEAGTKPGRYSLIGHSAKDGLEIVDGGLHCRIHHPDDPAHGATRNAFDLMRIHTFGDSEGSVAKMMALAQKDERCNLTGARKDFDELPDADSDEGMGIGEDEADIDLSDYVADVETYGLFWSVKKGRVTIERSELAAWLEAEGFAWYAERADSGTALQLVSVVEGVVRESSVDLVRKAVARFIEGLGEDDLGGAKKGVLIEAVHKPGTICDYTLDFLPRVGSDRFLRDTEREAFCFFQNGILAVRPDSMEMKRYGELRGLIWQSAIKDRCFDLEAAKADGRRSVMSLFMEAVSGYDKEKMAHGMRVFGYAQHGFKKESEALCPILCEETDDEAKGGGTGKGILIKALGYMVPLRIINGKGFDPEKTFAFQSVKVGDRLVVLDDVDKNFKMESLNSQITEGMMVERKHQPAIHIPYRDSPKIVITTNYTIPATSVHAQRRQNPFELAKTFGRKYKPIHEFGHELYVDWDAAEWDRFTYWMLTCVQKYMKEGMPVQELSEASRHKQIKDQFGVPQYDWVMGYLANGCEEEAPATELYEHCRASCGGTYGNFTMVRFHRLLKESAELRGGELIRDRKVSVNPDTRKKEDRITYKVTFANKSGTV